MLARLRPNLQKGDAILYPTDVGVKPKGLRSSPRSARACYAPNQGRDKLPLSAVLSNKISTRSLDQRLCHLTPASLSSRLVGVAAWAPSPTKSPNVCCLLATKRCCNDSWMCYHAVRDHRGCSGKGLSTGKDTAAGDSLLREPGLLPQQHSGVVVLRGSGRSEGPVICAYADILFESSIVKRLLAVTARHIDSGGHRLARLLRRSRRSSDRGSRERAI